jgi:multiple sugar transport system ATP-binding protein
MRIELAKLHRQLKATMIYVTHDQVEAMTMADRIVVLNAGEIAQTGAPLELYHKPANMFVAGFIGNPKMNMLPVICKSVGATGVEIEFQGQTATIPVEGRAGLVGQPLTLGIRPEHIQFGAADLAMTIAPSVIEHLGAHTVAYAAVNGEGENFCAMLPGSAAIRTEETVPVGLNAADCHLFDAHGIALERRLELGDVDMGLLKAGAV